jgi:lysozyme family protein
MGLRGALVAIGRMTVTVDKLKDVAVSHFQKAYKKMLEAEGFYSNDPFDPGGETFLGISRYWHPSWPGWQMIDKFGVEALPPFVVQNLYDLAEKFYKVQFWDRCQGDKLADLSPAISEKIFNTAVNLSVTDSIRWLQDSMNLLNINTELYPDILVDGRIGKVTIGTLKNFLNSRGSTEDMLIDLFGTLQGYHYVEEMRRNPTRERFRGWFDRAAA